MSKEARFALIERAIDIHHDVLKKAGTPEEELARRLSKKSHDNFKASLAMTFVLGDLVRWYDFLSEEERQEVPARLVELVADAEELLAFQKTLDPKAP